MPTDAIDQVNVIAIILGASAFPDSSSLDPKPSFLQSAKAIQRYFNSCISLDVPPDNILYLFDSPLSADDQDREISSWIAALLRRSAEEGKPVTDVIVYYVGHGCFHTDGQQYALAIRKTRSSQVYASSYQISALAQTLREVASGLRKYLILDCCFSASAYSAFQSGPLEVVRQKTVDVLPPETQPTDRGTALLCASGPKDPALAPADLKLTMFTYALLEVLRSGDQAGGRHFSLVDIGLLVSSFLRRLYVDASARPEVLSPDQSRGDVAKCKLFPNAIHHPPLRDTVALLVKRLEEIEGVVREANVRPSLREIIESLNDRLDALDAVVKDAAPDVGVIKKMQQSLNVLQRDIIDLKNTVDAKLLIAAIDNQNRQSESSGKDSVIVFDIPQREWFRLNDATRTLLMRSHHARRTGLLTYCLSVALGAFATLGVLLHLSSENDSLSVARTVAMVINKSILAFDVLIGFYLLPAFTIRNSVVTSSATVNSDSDRLSVSRRISHAAAIRALGVPLIRLASNVYIPAQSLYVLGIAIGISAAMAAVCTRALFGS